jgi:hypothetical protein
MSTPYCNYTRITGDTNEHLISAIPVRVHAIVPEFTTTGTVTVRDDSATGGSATMHVCAIGLTQAGKQFGGDGVRSQKGLTVQLSVNTDAVMVCWSPLN